MNRKLLITLIILVGTLLASCNAANTRPFGTPIPTLIPATMPAPVPVALTRTDKVCTIHAVDLLAAWVTAGYPETNAFDFVGADGKACSGTFQADVAPLFDEPNLWYAGAISCASCHGPDLQVSYAKLNLADYPGIVAGSRRPDANTNGDDILGGGVWESSKLYNVLVKMKFMPLGRPESMPEKGPLVEAGTPK
jgi:hypothetical protein